MLFYFELNGLFGGGMQIAIYSAYPERGVHVTGSRFPKNQAVGFSLLL